MMQAWRGPMGWIGECAFMSRDSQCTCSRPNILKYQLARGPPFQILKQSIVECMPPPRATNRDNWTDRARIGALPVPAWVLCCAAEHARRVPQSAERSHSFPRCPPSLSFAPAAAVHTRQKRQRRTVRGQLRMISQDTGIVMCLIKLIG